MSLAASIEIGRNRVGHRVFTAAQLLACGNCGGQITCGARMTRRMSPGGGRHRQFWFCHECSDVVLIEEAS